MFRNCFPLSALLLATPLLMAVPSPATQPGPASDDNLALHKPYRLSARPSYPLTTDAGDRTQLTDGVTVETLGSNPNRMMWLFKEAVAWRNLRQAGVITIDLGSVQPIRGAAFHTAYGKSDWRAPVAVCVLVSDDDKDYYYLGNLVEDLIPKPNFSGYERRVYRREDLPTRARYVQIVPISNHTFMGSDEIEVLAGKPDQADLPRGKKYDLQSDADELKHDVMVRRRLLIDLAKFESVSGKPASPELRAEVGQPDMHADQIVWRNGMPWNDLQRRIWAEVGRARRGDRGPELIVQAVHPWAPVQPLDGPSTSALPAVTIHACNGEFRAGAINITNDSDDAAVVSLSCDLSGAGLPDDLIQVSSVGYLDTKGGDAIGPSLLPVASEDGRWRLDVPAGATRQAWLRVHPRDVKPGSYQLALTVRCAAPTAETLVPLVLEVHEATFSLPDARLQTSLWDYCGSPGKYPDHLIPQGVALMREYGVRTAWLNSAGLPWPKVGRELNSDGAFVQEIAPQRWAVIDRWLELWPDARTYCIFANVRETMPEAGFRRGTPEFERAVAGFFQRLGDHFRERGIDPKRMAICFFDEPKDDATEQITVDWHNAARKGNPHYRLFSDPNRRNPRQMLPQFVQALDILCPNAHYSLGQPANIGMPGFQEASQGKEFWIYDCDVPVTELDPYFYHRLMAWRCFRYGATTQGFWSFGHINHMDYKAGGWVTWTWGHPEASVSLWDEKGFERTKYLEAIREGVQDYELLARLRQAIDACPDRSRADAARRQLDELVERVTGTYELKLTHQVGPAPRGAADEARVEVLRLLADLPRP